MIWVFASFTWLRGGRGRRFVHGVFGLLRAAIYVSLVAAVVGVLAARRALADVRQEGTTLGRELVPLADLLQGTTALRINGERLFFSMTTQSDSDVHRVLDRFQRQCEARPGPFAAKMRALAEQFKVAAPLTSVLRQAALLRDESADRGTLFCFTGNDSNPDHEPMAERFAATRDLGALGNLRYVIASRGSAAEHEQGLTKVVALWTEGSFRLDRLTPPVLGDTPGSDSTLLPRPPGSVRLFSAETIAAPYAVRIYETSQSPGEVLAFYDRAMRDWFVTEPKGAADEARGYVKNGKPLLVSVSRDEAKTLVTLSEVGAVH